MKTRTTTEWSTSRAAINIVGGMLLGKAVAWLTPRYKPGFHTLGLVNGSENILPSAYTREVLQKFVQAATPAR